jgi:hypothetical protein
MRGGAAADTGGVDDALTAAKKIAWLAHAAGLASCRRPPPLTEEQEAALDDADASLLAS